MDATRRRLIQLFPISHGLIHGVVDASCVGVVFAAKLLNDMPRETFFFFVLSYDLLAFAGQAVLGPLVDKLRFLRGAVVTGIVGTIGAVLLLTVEPTAAMLCAGVGNALFHLGAGALSMNVEPGRATGPGIFVAPGVLGLAVGTYVGRGDLFTAWPFLLALGLSLAITLASPHPHVPYDAPPPRPAVDRPWLIGFLLLGSIAVRSLIGRAGGYEVPKMPEVAFGLAAAAFAGKAMGGLLADRFGWIRITVGALLLSAPLVAFGGSNSAAVTIGMWLFQMTMPVTLVALYALMPGRPAFAFGLTCLALILGGLPTFFRAIKAHYDSWAFLVLILISAAALYEALRRLRGAVPMRFPR